MRAATVGLIAASALTANAILLPPGITSTKNDVDLTFAFDTNSQSIKLACPECVSTSPEEHVESEDGEDAIWIQGGANDVLLDFKVENGKSLELNGYTLFPPSENRLEESLPTVSQVSSSSSLLEIKEGSASAKDVQVTGSGVYSTQEHVSPAGDAIIRVTFQLMALDDHPVTVSGAEVTMLKNADGELMILGVEPAPERNSIFDALPPVPHNAGAPEPSKECNLYPKFMCKVANMFDNVENAFDSSINDIKAGLPKMKGGCHGKVKGNKLPIHIGGPPPHFAADGKSSFPEGDRPEHPHHGGKKPGMRPHGEHPHGEHPHGAHAHGHEGPHRHHHMHLMHKIVKGFVMVLIPVMAGITMGMTVSLIGMLVGRLIALLWVKFARGGQRGYARVALQESETEEGFSPVNEKMVYEEAVVEEALPRYEDAPAYEATEESK